MNFLDKAALIAELETCGVVSMHPIGSRRIPGAATEESDYDFACLVDDLSEAAVKLLAAGWQDCADGHPEYEALDSGSIHERFIARKGEVNLIVFHCVAGYSANVFAQTVCEKKGLVDREDRVEVFIQARSMTE